jgi:hypothetical protein
MRFYVLAEANHGLTGRKASEINWALQSLADALNKLAKTLRNKFGDGDSGVVFIPFGEKVDLGHMMDIQVCGSVEFPRAAGPRARGCRLADAVRAAREIHRDDVEELGHDQAMRIVVVLGAVPPNGFDDELDEALSETPEPGFQHLVVACDTKIAGFERLADLFSVVDADDPGLCGALKTWACGGPAAKAGGAKGKAAKTAKSRPRGEPKKVPSSPAAKRKSSSAPASRKSASAKRSAGEADAAAKPATSSLPPLRAVVDAAADGEPVDLGSGEYAGGCELAGNVTLEGESPDRPAHIVGLDGPALRLSGSLTLVNVAIEAAPGGVALERAEGASLSVLNVTVRGKVVGIAGEDGDWDIPTSVSLPSLPVGADCRRTLVVEVPVACAVTSGIAGIEPAAKSVGPGVCRIELAVEAGRAGTVIFGYLNLDSPYFRRKIQLTAKHLPGPGPKADAVAWACAKAPPDAASEAAEAVSAPAPMPDPAGVDAPAAPGQIFADAAGTGDVAAPTENREDGDGGADQPPAEETPPPTTAAGNGKTAVTWAAVPFPATQGPAARRRSAKKQPAPAPPAAAPKNSSCVGKLFLMLLCLGIGSWIAYAALSEAPAAPSATIPEAPAAPEKPQPAPTPAPTAAPPQPAPEAGGIRLSGTCTNTATGRTAPFAVTYRSVGGSSISGRVEVGQPLHGGGEFTGTSLNNRVAFTTKDESFVVSWSGDVTASGMSGTYLATPIGTTPGKSQSGTWKAEDPNAAPGRLSGTYVNKTTGKSGALRMTFRSVEGSSVSGVVDVDPPLRGGGEFSGTVLNDHLAFTTKDDAFAVSWSGDVTATALSGTFLASPIGSTPGKSQSGTWSVAIPPAPLAR